MLKFSKLFTSTYISEPLTYINQFLANVLILYSLVTPENLLFSDVSRGYEVEVLARNDYALIDKTQKRI